MVLIGIELCTASVKQVTPQKHTGPDQTEKHEMKDYLYFCHCCKPDAVGKEHIINK